MKRSTRLAAVSLASLCVAIAVHAQTPAGPFDLSVLPTEHKKVADATTGAELIFLTTNPAKDLNLYFHERSWLADSSMILFTSERENGGAMAYIVATGELVRLTTPNGSLGAINAAKDRNSVFGIRGDVVIELALTLNISSSPESSPSKVTAVERIIARLPNASANTPASESCDGKHLAVGVNFADGMAGILLVDQASGEARELCRVGTPPGYGGHVQWSQSNPNLLSYAGRTHRLMVVDIRDGVPRSIYTEQEGELITHEHWWIADEHGDDQMVFCGGTHPKPTEDADVKVINVRTGAVRILGSGSWWPDATAEELAKRNFWHCAGSANGRWVVADNWHGDITIFEGKTVRPHVLTAGHRTYGRGDHPHVGWDRKGRQVVFTSGMLGDSNVCVAAIPEKWQGE